MLKEYPYKSLVEEITENGETAIKNIVDRESESYFLDYKKAGSDDYSDKKSLPTSDVRNLSKAISGFGNSAGGILIFGVKDDGTLNPFKGYKNFEQVALGQVSRLTNPAHNLVHAFFVPSQDSEKGYVIVEIPKSNFSPLQTISNQVGYRYYMRSGESFVDVPHDVLAGMFGKRPNPELGNIFSISENVNPEAQSAEYFIFTIMIRNFGSVTVKDLWVNLTVSGVPGMKYHPTEVANDNFDIFHLSNHFINSISKDGYKLPPQVPVSIFKIYIPKEIPGACRGDEFEFYFSYGCESSMPYEFKSEWTRDEYANFSGISREDFLEFLKSKDNSRK